MAEIYKKLDLEPAECQEALETAIERTLNSQQNAISLEQAREQAKINERIETEVNAEFALPSSKEMAIEQTLALLANADKKMKEEYLTEIIARHYGINTNKKTSKALVPSTLEEITKKAEKEQIELDSHFKKVDAYIRDRKYSEKALDSSQMQNLDYLAKAAVLNGTEVKIYKSALEKIDKLLSPLQFRNPDIYSAIRELKFAQKFTAISGAFLSTAIAAMSIGSAMNMAVLHYAGLASIIFGSISTAFTLGNLGDESSSTILTSSDRYNRYSSPKSNRGSNGRLEYKCAVAKHIQQNGKTTSLDLEVAIQYGQKLQESLKKIDCLSKEGQENIIEVQERIKVADEYLSAEIQKLKEISGIDNPETTEEQK